MSARLACAAASAALAFAACSFEEGGGAEGVVAAGVRYELDWEDGGAARAGDGALELVNDLGVAVRLEAGYVTSWSASLVACAPASVAGLRLGPPRALAGHAFGAEPSTLEDPLVEDVVGGGRVTFGARTFDPKAYCQAHYAIGAAQAPRGAPEDVGMTGTSLWLAGTFARPGEPPTAFVARSPVADGLLADLPAASGGALTVRIVRDRGRLFDGVAFEGLDEATGELPAADAKRVLSNLVEAARFEVGDP